MTFDGTLPNGWDISSRLMARWTFEDGSTIEVDSSGEYYLSAANEYFPNRPGRILAHGTDFRPSPLSTGWADILGAMVSFLSADAESYRYTMGNEEPDDGWLFGRDGAEWAYLHDAELSMLSLDLEESR